MLFALALAVAPATPVGCYRPAAGEVVAQRASLRSRNAVYEAVSVSRRQPGQQALDGRMIVFDRRCTRLFERDFGDAWEVRFQLVRLGNEPVLMATGLSPGASSSGYRHVLLAYGARVRDVTPGALETSTLDGIFVGDLGRRRGPGLVRWDGIWGEDEGHYGRHRFQVTFWRWRSGRLVGGSSYTTRNRFDAEPDRAARALGFRFRDMTRTVRFALTNAIMEERMRPDR